MATILEKQDRNVIPRWRDFRTTLELGELTQPSILRKPNDAPLDLADLESDWKSEGTLSFAADLISAASLAGNNEAVKEAAAFIIEHPLSPDHDHPLTRMANAILSGTDTTVVREIETLPVQIGTFRRKLAEFPRDAIQWVDLALLYAMHGMPIKSRKAMLVALGIAPQDRFVLRSASRLFLHLHEPELAHLILKNSPLAKIDPWLVAAEIAVASAGNRLAFNVDRGLEILSSEQFAPFETSELSTAIAKLEFESGSIRKAKKHIKRALLQPNENSLAQAKWISREIGGSPIDVKVSDFNVARSFEAQTLEAFMKKDWVSSASGAVSWLKDQPFASRPAVVASHLASTLLEDYDNAIVLAKLGQIANPNDHLLHISLAFSYGSTGRTREALEQVVSIKGGMTNSVRVAMIGNFGLIAFREGRLEEGRYYYSKAVEQAEIFADNNLIAAALTYWAREEGRLSTDLTPEILSRAAEAIKKSDSVEGGFVFDRIEKRYKNLLAPTSPLDAPDKIKGYRKHAPHP